MSVMEADSFGWCPACGDPIDFCTGHGEIGDPVGHRILERHDLGDHSGCHQICAERNEEQTGGGS